MKCKILVFAFAVLSAATLSASTLSISRKDALQVILPENPTGMERFLAKDLCEHLALRTGARVAVSETPAAIKVFLRRNPAFKEQEYAFRNGDNELVFEGKNEFGLVNAVYTFLEDVAGFRWYSAFGARKIPAKGPLVLKDLNTRRIPSFLYRDLRLEHHAHPESQLFAFRNRLNTGSIFQEDNLCLKDIPLKEKIPGLKPFCDFDGASSHTFFSYIPSKSTKNNWSFHWKDNIDYFVEHPEFYSMDENGKRVNTMQLCLSNPELRKIILRHMSERFEQYPNLDNVSFSAEDFARNLCCCPQCRALEKKYQCPGGPLFDFILEACEYLKKNHPGKGIYTLAYRKEQTEIPPTLAGGKFPDNFSLIFAPIDDDVSKPVTHKNNAGTYENLKKWCKLVKHVWIWNYPIAFCGDTAPFLPLDRYSDEIKAHVAAGADGGFYQHTVGYYYGYNFHDMLKWIFAKLYFDCNADVWALAGEYCNQAYGNAAGEVLAFARELSDYAKNETMFMPWDAGKYYPRFWSFEKIAEYNKKFEQWEKLTAAQPSALAEFQILRTGIDVMMLKNYQQMKKKNLMPPDVTPDFLLKRLKTRLDASLARRYPVQDCFLKKWVLQHKSEDMMLKRAYDVASMEPKPLPAEFAAVPQYRIAQILPLAIWGTQTVRMADAAYGKAIYTNPKFVHRLAAEVSFGIYDAVKKKEGCVRILTPKDIVPGKFKLYKLGTFVIPQSGYYHFGNWSGCSVADELYNRDAMPGTLYDVYFSLKFEGPLFNGREKENRIYCDRIVRVVKE